MGNETKAVVTKGPKEGLSLSVVGGTYRILISGKETGGTFSTIHMLIPPGAGPGPHAHPAFQESFYVIEGEIEVKSEEGVYIATKGSFVNIPTGGIVHCFKNKSNAQAQLLCTVVPAGLEEFFEEIGEPVSDGQVLSAPPMDRGAMEKLQAIAEKHGQKIFPPDYLDK
jgi:quercetin dioxygenase-like cupin family protein